MNIRRFTYRQIRWIFLSVAFLVLLGGGLFLDGKVVDQLLTWITEVSPSRTQPMKEMAEMEMKGVPRRSDMGPAQGSPMVSPMRQQLIGVRTAVVEKRRLSTTVRAVGKVTYNEQRITHVNLRISGWIEDLLVDYTGQPVQKGQPLFTLYSPELVATQDEYLLALRAFEDVQNSPVPEVHDQAQQLIDAARDRLRLWTFTDDQIDKLKRQRIPQTSVTVFSPMSGHVIDKTAFQGMFVQPKMTMYTIADLSTVWVQAEVYEYEVPFIKIGQAAVLTLEAFPGEPFSGRVTYVYPYLNKEARTVQVRLEFSNPHFRLKPDMYGTVLFQVDRGSSLAVPEQAVLDSGVRQVVFVEKGKGVFEPREVTLGPKVGSYFEVVKGLKEGERIVTSGTFLLDSESKLMTSSNMMGALGMGGIQMEQAQMGEMDMGGMKMDMEMEKGQDVND